MKVAELIERLLKQPQGNRVLFESPGGDFLDPDGVFDAGADACADEEDTQRAVSVVGLDYSDVSQVDFD